LFNYCQEATEGKVCSGGGGVNYAGKYGMCIVYATYLYSQLIYWYHTQNTHAHTHTL